MRSCVPHKPRRKMAEAKEVVRMYRRILKLAQRYPSVKRDSIVRDIKTEFHENKLLTDAQKIREQLAAARAGITELSQYANLHPGTSSWSVEVGRDALQPPPPAHGGVTHKIVGGDRDK
ncbi:hypothetical protein BBJ28_00008251 [Nothophytophthora sp. Chile5]|nr:hypothetical protein BBJ28_00008251 [Nothophytophthora sp. Chile5]